jgi:hypothetical protein
MSTKDKPRFGDACNGCGACCRTALCNLADAKGHTSVPCPELVERDGMWRCGIVVTEEASGMEPKAAYRLGIGVGCGMPDDDTTDEEYDVFVEFAVLKTRQLHHVTNWDDEPALAATQPPVQGQERL